MAASSSGIVTRALLGESFAVTSRPHPLTCLLPGSRRIDSVVRLWFPLIHVNNFFYKLCFVFILTNIFLLQDGSISDGVGGVVSEAEFSSVANQWRMGATVEEGLPRVQRCSRRQSGADDDNDDQEDGKRTTNPERLVYNVERVLSLT